MMRKGKFFAFLFSLVLIMGIDILHCNKVFAYTIGNRITEAEDGWKRYNDTDENIEYSSEIFLKNGGAFGYYNNDLHSIVNTGGIIKFSFYGSKLRLYEHIYSNRPSNIRISLDGGMNFESASSYGEDTPQAQELYFEKTQLKKAIHQVVIEVPAQQGTSFGFDCFDIDEDGYLISKYNVLNIEPEKEKINLNEDVTANVIIDNITEIAAEDIRIKYDAEKLKFLGAEEVDGIKVVKSEENDGELRVILASQGISNVVFMKKTLLKLNFQGIATGEALVDITKGRISDGITMERDLVDDECGQAIIVIEDYKDPNKDGEFTLLDLAIDGRYYGLNPDDYPQYKTDVVENGAIDDEDLLEIGKYILENPNYTF